MFQKWCGLDEMKLFGYIIMMLGEVMAHGTNIKSTISFK